MKKLILIGLAVGSLFAANIKQNDVFIGGTYGYISSAVTKDNIAGIRIGKYFYDTNPYNISNRYYLEVSKTLENNNKISLYIANANLDWLIDMGSFLKPFVGINTGYVYNDSNTDNSTSTVGLKAGLLLYLGDSIEIEGGISTNKPLQKKDVWTDNIKSAYASINISF
jgi:hypothetical protein